MFQINFHTVPYGRRKNFQRQYKQKGLAIITVLLIVALMVTLIGFLVEQQHIYIRRVSNHNIAEQGYHIALGFEHWAKQELISDIDPLKDYLGEDWALLGKEPEPEEESSFSLQTTGQKEEERKQLEFELGDSKIKVVDMQGRYNLNNLIYGNPAQRKQQQRIFMNLLEILGVDELQRREELYGALYDWLDENDFTVANGYESNDYRSLTTPYYAADQALSAIGELKFVRGFDTALIRQLIDHVTVLPVPFAGININTTSAEVLASLSSSVVTDITPVDAFLIQRENPAFVGFDAANIDEAVDAVIAVSATGTTQPYQSMMQVTSEYFQVYSQWSAGDYTYCMQTLLHRPPPSSNNDDDSVVDVIRRQYNTLCYEDIH